MLPAREADRVKHIQETLKEIRLFDVSTKFLADYTDENFKLSVHAELLLVEHFYYHNFDFVNNDRYIGCSKPSCYCCDLYMKCHPGNYVQRACHGNLWIKWEAPAPPTEDREQARKHTASILNEMVVKIRKDVLFQIESKLPRRPRVPDSTTGISSEISGLQAAIRTRSISVSSWNIPVMVPTTDFAA